MAYSKTKYEVNHLLSDNDKVSTFKTDKDFVSFVRKIVKENEDNVNIASIHFAINYIISYCSNLQLTIK